MAIWVYVAGWPVILDQMESYAESVAVSPTRDIVYLRVWEGLPRAAMVILLVLDEDANRMAVLRSTRVERSYISPPKDLVVQLTARHRASRNRPTFVGLEKTAIFS